MITSENGIHQRVFTSRITPYLPPRRFSDVGRRREFPSENAVCMSLTAVVSCSGVGEVKSAASKLPTTCVEPAVVPDTDLTIENPVSEVEDAGLTPTLPTARPILLETSVWLQQVKWLTDGRLWDSGYPSLCEDCEITCGTEINRRRSCCLSACRNYLKEVNQNLYRRRQ